MTFAAAALTRRLGHVETLVLLRCDPARPPIRWIIIEDLDGNEIDRLPVWSPTARPE